MITLEYSKLGTPINDWEAKSFVLNLINAGNDTEIYRISSEKPFHLIRQMVVHDEIPAELFCFLYDGNFMHLNTYGAIFDGWAEGFCDEIPTIAEDIIRTALNKGK